jgi:hypothetical protein
MLIEFTPGRLLLSVFVLLAFASVSLFWHYAYDNMKFVFGTVLDLDEYIDSSGSKKTETMQTNSTDTNASSVVPTTTIDESTSNFTSIFEFPDIALKMKYPGNWEKVEYGRAVKAYGEGIIASLLSPLEASSDKFREVVLIKVENLSSPSVKDLPSDNSIGGNPTYQVVFDRPNLANKSDIIMTLKEWTPLNDKAFAIEFSAEKSKFKDYLPLVTQIIGSIQLNGVSTSSVSANESDQLQTSSIASQDGEEATITSGDTTTQTASVIEKLLQRDIDMNETKTNSETENVTR